MTIHFMIHIAATIVMFAVGAGAIVAHDLRSQRKEERKRIKLFNEVHNKQLA